jgi:hypothetical protein
MLKFKNKNICFLSVLVLSMFISTDLQAKNCDSWQFEVSPYLWAASMNGNVGVGARSAHTSQKFTDLVKHLDSAGMLWIAAKKNNVGLFANAIYIKLSDDKAFSVYNNNITIKATNKSGYFTIGMSYTIYERNYGKLNNFYVAPYIGARYTLNNTTLKLLETSNSVSNNQHWTDPIIGLGLRNNYLNWRFWLGADVGGTNFNNQKSLNIDGLVGYNPTSAKNWTFYLGYKYLYQKYITGSGGDYFAWNMRLFGPLLGLSYKF